MYITVANWLFVKEKLENEKKHGHQFQGLLKGLTGDTIPPPHISLYGHMPITPRLYILSCMFGELHIQEYILQQMLFLS